LKNLRKADKYPIFYEHSSILDLFKTSGKVWNL
jgi:hypothetical protein